MKKPAILIAEKDQLLRQNMKCRLRRHGFDVIEAYDTTDVLEFLKNKSPDLVIVGSSPDFTWYELELVKKIRNCDRRIPLILITRHSSEKQVIAALRAGVNDYLKLPFSWKELVESVKRNLAHNRIGIPGLSNDQPMIGESEPIQEIRRYLLKVAVTDSTVLITGETGTGKELAAELIHQNSLRNKELFVCINCAALPEGLLESELFGYERGAFTGAVATKRGKFELADGGTVFLDEIGDMSPHAQAKILRTIERKEVYRLGGKLDIPLDVRIIAATNQNPERLVSEGKLRKDLYYRLNVARAHIPPLRERKEDILSLIDHYIRELNHRFGSEVEGFTEDTLASLLHYDWPGNVRELKNFLEATFINLPSRRITLINLPKMFQKRLKEAAGLPESERDRLLAMLFATNWNKSRAAQKLHWSRMTLYRKMAKYHIPRIRAA